MALTERSISLTNPVSLDQELEALQRAVAEARRNRWHGGDVIEPEFETFLAALTNPRPLDYAANLEPSPEWRAHRNSWREVLDQV